MEPNSAEHDTARPPATPRTVAYARSDGSTLESLGTASRDGYLRRYLEQIGAELELSDVPNKSGNDELSTRDGAVPLRALLQSLRVPQDEVQLTHCISRLAQSDRGVAEGLARGLLTCAERSEVLGPRAKALRDALPESYAWEGEVPARGDRKRIGFRKRSEKRGKIDWRLVAPPNEPAHPELLLGVEVKVGAKVTDQLLTYYEDLARHQAPHWGLLLLAPRVPAQGLLDPQFPHWLGVVLWSDLLAELKSVSPIDPELAAAWPHFLEILNENGDLGAAPITVGSLSADGFKRHLTALADHAHGPVHEAFNDALTRRPGGATRRHTARVARHGRERASVSLRCFLNANDNDPGLELKLHVESGRLLIRSYVLPYEGRQLPGKRKARQLSVQKLHRLTPPFLERHHYLVRDLNMHDADADVRDAVADVLCHEVQVVVRTGIFDHDPE